MRRKPLGLTLESIVPPEQLTKDNGPNHFAIKEEGHVEEAFRDTNFRGGSALTAAEEEALSGAGEAFQAKITNLASAIKSNFANKQKLDLATMAIECPQNLSGINQHFIITTVSSGVEGDKKEAKRFHAKMAMDPSRSKGSRLNEVMVYDVLDKVGYGPRNHSMVLPSPEGENSTSANLVIVTEDLSNPNFSKPDKKIKFETRSEIEARESAVASNRPNLEDRRYNVHMTCCWLISQILNLHDVKSNAGNTGTRTTVKKAEEGAVVTKQKPFIIDFTLQKTEEFRDPNAAKGVAKAVATALAQDFVKSVEPLTKDDLQMEMECFRGTKFKMDRGILREAIARLEDGRISSDSTVRPKASLPYAIMVAYQELEQKYGSFPDDKDHVDIVHDELVTNWNKFNKAFRKHGLSTTKRTEEEQSSDSGREESLSTSSSSSPETGVVAPNTVVKKIPTERTFTSQFRGKCGAVTPRSKGN